MELLQFPVEIKEALGCGSGHAAVHLVQLLLDMLCHLDGSKARGDTVRPGQEGSFWSEGQLRALLFLLGGISGDLLGQTVPMVTLWAQRGSFSCSPSKFATRSCHLKGGQKPQPGFRS